MKITIDSTSRVKTDRIRDLLHFNLSAFEAEIRRVHVTIRAESDALGADLSRCRVVTHLANRECIQTEELQASEALALSRAFERTGRTLNRKCRTGSDGLTY